MNMLRRLATALLVAISVPATAQTSQISVDRKLYRSGGTVPAGPTFPQGPPLVIGSGQNSASLDIAFRGR